MDTRPRPLDRLPPSGGDGILARLAALEAENAALRRRLDVLTAPGAVRDPLRLQDLVDVQEIQLLQDAFAGAAGISSVIEDVDGVPITRPSLTCRLCRDVGAAERGEERCAASQAAAGRAAHWMDARPCQRVGLMNGEASIRVGGREIARWRVGQVLDERCDPERVRRFAEEVGFEHARLQEALHAVPHMSRGRFQRIETALELFAGSISRLAYHNQQQARHIAERERSEATLRESQARLRLFAENVRDVVWTADLDLRFTFVSPSVEALLGLTQEEALRRTLDDELTPDSARLARKTFADDLALARSGARPPAHSLELELRREDGSTVWSDVRTTLVLDCAGRPVAVAGVAADATERRRAEAERQALEAELRQSQRLEAIGRLAGGIAHDFNNLLSVILSGAEVLQHDLRAGAAPDLEIVDEIALAGGRARDLTRQLLAFARKQVVAPAPLDLNLLVRGTERLLRRLLGEDVELRVALGRALWPVRADPGQIEQVIVNLAVNARDAMPCGGRLAIETSNVEVTEALAATHSSLRPGPHVRLAIRDTGAGMTPEVKARMFEPFFTTKPQGRGTGLGLATVYGIMKAGGGHILVESEPGQGTRLELLFPRVEGEAIGAEPPPSRASERGSETVLVVEDDPHVCAVTVRALRSAGYEVLVAHDGRQALEIGGADGVPIDLLLTDVVMPGLGGRAVADELVRRRPGLPVLYVSGHDEDAVVQHGVRAPGEDVLQKPFTASTLLGRVRQVLDS